jgi:V/A-type H+-transporting ATPase subunit F
MRYFLICDNTDTQTGLRLAGIEGVVSHDKGYTEELIRAALLEEDLGVLLITEKLASLCPNLISDIKLNYLRPLLVVIPDRHGTTRPPDSITRHIREAIGVKL